MPKWSARGRCLGGAESWLVLVILTVAPTWAQQGNSQQGRRAPGLRRAGRGKARRPPADKAPTHSYNSTSRWITQVGILAVGIDERIRSMVGSLRISSGVIVLGRAASLLGPDIGLTTGDVIHAMNNRPVDTVDNLRSALSQLKSGDSVAMQVERQGKLQFLAFEMD